MAIPVGMLISLASAGIKAYQGSRLQQRAKEEAASAPKSVIPETARTGLAHASNVAKGRMAGAAEAERAMDEAEASVAYRGERAATSAQQLQGLISAGQGTRSRMARSLAEKEAQDKVARESAYVNQLYNFAAMEQQVDDSNKANAWNIEQGVKAAGRKQVSEGLSQAVATAMLAMGEEEVNIQGGGLKGTAEEATEVVSPQTPEVKATEMPTSGDTDSGYQTYLQGKENPMPYDIWLTGMSEEEWVKQNDPLAGLK